MSASPDIYRLRCPGCDEEVDVAMESVGQLARCPYCNTDFFASEEQSHLEVVDDTPVDPNPPDPELEFTKFRIRSLAALRMTAVRGFSRYLIVFWVCVVGGLETIDRAILDAFRNHAWSIWQTIQVIMGIALLVMSRQPRRQAKAFKKELAESALAEPQVEPDFSTLRDGSQRWQDLENIH